MHSDFYRKNRAYAERLRDLDPRQCQSLPVVCRAAAFHEKYVRALSWNRAAGEVVLDVGCGAGQAVEALHHAGLRVHGIDVSEEAIALAGARGGTCRVFDGMTIPYPDEYADAVGACNVLEHVDDPPRLLDEMLRVLKPGGRLVVSSPNFLRVFGWRDYHPRMRGLAQKYRNARTLLRHRELYARDRNAVRFETLVPLRREPAQPDDDAVAATSSLDLRQYFFTRGLKNIAVSCVDRPVPRWLETLLDLTPLRFLILNSFVTGEKPTTFI